MLLSAVMIVRDEAAFLPGCLDSITGVVDEIVIVDTGSRDDTVDLARAAGAAVTHRAWDDDFAAARNAALDQARGDWVLYIDADERLSGAGELRARLAASHAVAGRVRFRTSRHLTRYREYRLFRNRPDIRFRGAIHETMVPDILRIAAAEGAPLEDMPADIDHLGYDGDQAPKHERNLPLLERQVVEDPDRVYLWFHLGVVQEGLGDAAAAEAAWARGVEIARRSGGREPFGVLVLARLALYRLHKGRPAADLVADLEAWFPDDPLTIWVAAHAAMTAGRWLDAAGLLEDLWRIDAEAVLHPVLAYDQRMFGEFAAHNLGLCWFHEGDDARAAHWFAEAAELAPDVEEYDVKRRLAAARAHLR